MKGSMHNNGMKMTILIVDDDPDARSVLKRFMEDLGHEAREARDGQDGLDAALRERPNAIISDGLMPRMDGFGVIEGVFEKREDQQVGKKQCQEAEEDVGLAAFHM